MTRVFEEASTLTIRQGEGESLHEIDLCQSERFGSLIHYKQAVIGMYAVIFHVRVLISSSVLIILSKYLNPMIRCQRGKLFAIRPLIGAAAANNLM